MTTTPFNNDVLASGALPDLRALVFEPVSPRYRLVNLTLVGLIFGFMLGVLAGLYFQPFVSLPEELYTLLPVLMTVALLVGVSLLLYHYFADPLIGFSLRAQDITLKCGLFFRKITTQPILRVQHVALKQGPVDRLAGLAKLQAFSAGGAMHTFAIPGLPHEQALSIRQFILDHKDLDAK